MTLFCANDTTSIIQHGGDLVCLGSHSQEPSGDGNWDELHHRRTEDFTMEEVHVVGGMAAGLRCKSPSGAQGQSPGRGPLGTSPRS